VKIQQLVSSHDDYPLRCVRRAFLHTAFKENSPLACQLLTIHNVSYMMRLMRTMRESILQGQDAFTHYVRTFLTTLFPTGAIPQWVVDALQYAHIDVGDMKLVPDEVIFSKQKEKAASDKKGADGEGGDDMATIDDDE
jgi:hypothetical protein